jgi:predicted Rossmann fold flavoprotein
MSSPHVVIVGGGAAGFFAAINCAEANPAATVTILEQAPEVLGKVRISGGGRCNVTHVGTDEREFVTHYPRGSRELIGPFCRFGPRETIAWFLKRGVRLNALSDGCIFPLTDKSETIVDCLTSSAAKAGVKVRTNCGAERASRPFTAGDERAGRPFHLTLTTGETLTCDRLLLATGGCRPDIAELVTGFGHTIEPPVPSLFTFNLDTPWLRELAGIVVEQVEASVPGTKLRTRGPLLVTHTGLSGPAILRLSAWGARELHARNYQFPLALNWVPNLGPGEVEAELEFRRTRQPARLISNAPLPPIPVRLWEQLVLAAGIGGQTRWSALPRPLRQRLVRQLVNAELTVTGRSVHKEEFVTCGGVRLSEVDFRTMESRRCPGLYFAGELLDIDGLTGGFNFQAAWTTGWLAGNALAAAQ